MSPRPQGKNQPDYVCPRTETVREHALRSHQYLYDNPKASYIQSNIQICVEMVIKKYTCQWYSLSFTETEGINFHGSLESFESCLLYCRSDITSL